MTAAEQKIAALTAERDAMAEVLAEAREYLDGEIADAGVRAPLSTIQLAARIDALIGAAT